MISKCKMKVDRIFFSNKSETGEMESGEYRIFTAELLEVKQGLTPQTHPIYNTVSLKGNTPPIKKGDILTFTLKEEEISSYGVSYILEDVSAQIDPNNKEEVKEFLNLVCGASVTKELMKLENSYEMLLNKDSENLLKVKGIGAKRLKSIYKNVDSFSDKGLAFAKLMPLGLSKQAISKMCEVLGGAAATVDICFNNPYKLVDKIKGFGFIKADDIAKKCNFVDEEKRVRYGVLHLLESNAQQGRSYLTSEQLMSELRRIDITDFGLVDKQIGLLNQQNRILLSNDGKMVALTDYFNLEKNIYDRLVELSESKSHIKTPDNWREIVEDIQKEQGWRFTDEQLKGIETVLNENVIFIKGLAGTGKSTITNAINKILEMYQTEMCCLSAKASQRLREVTGENAQTIHKLLNLGFGSGVKAQRIYADIIILDEASMVSGTLFLKLLKAIEKGSKLIVLGDSGQLTAIGDCSVFNDVVNSKRFKVVELTKIHRQAMKSAIITKSVDIRHQKLIYDQNFRGTITLGELQDLELTVTRKGEDLISKVRESFLKGCNEYGIAETQIVVPCRKGGLGIQQINNHIQHHVTDLQGDCFSGKDEVRIYTGDKVINTKNNYNTKDIHGNIRAVFNGSIGFVREIVQDGCFIDFIGIGTIFIPSKSYIYIDLAYAITVHAAQGSQWDKVICAFDMSAYIMLNVEIFYTAITRAGKKCDFIVEHFAMMQGIKTVEQKTKQTLLPMFLI